MKAESPKNWLIIYLINFMSDFIIKEVKNKEQWEDFLKSFERKSFLQSWNWGEFRKKMGEKIWRWGIYKDNYLKGIALITKVSAKRGKFLLVPHGPVAEENKKDILRKLTEEMKKLARKENCSFIRINPIWLRNKENASLFEEIGFRRAPLHSHPESSCRLNLNSSEEEILMAMRKNTRYYIRKALRNEDIKCFKSEKEESLKILNELHKKVSRDKNFIPFSPKYIKEEFNSFIEDNQACLFIGKYKDKVIASSFVLFWSGIGFYHHAALSPGFRKIPVSYLLQWEAIKEAKNRGCRIYDFWGYIDPQKYPNHPWAGPTLFKLGFGAQGEEYLFTQDLALSPLYYLTFIFEKIRKIKRGL